jgi:hypothetical protein
LSTHSSNPVLQGIYDPTLLERGPALAADITHLLTLLPADTTSTTTAPSPSESTPLPPFPLPTFLAPVFSNPAPALKNFLQHIHHLSTSSGQAPLLLAHAYVRYLGDLSGGQIIGGRIKRAYGLKEQQGTAFYDFSSKGSRSGFESDPSGEGGKKRLMDIKDWYRRGMDDGVGEDKDLKGKLSSSPLNQSADICRETSSRGKLVFCPQHQSIRPCSTSSSKIISRNKRRRAARFPDCR